ncbi:hypothetical protein W97_05886 [Coniosporium apollinis CBS 100218]|uniref:Small ribosomal subunit protein uS10m n=1 Tax=Coniosporium apollinis (strain CBS 100218) TaxID=1168221 RepID=R7YXI9_CONA1|nr:uncharacterized protein W97_05886 [Coniosporium apollinis CBS 100218]EON66640.1 hypothetical protein W97_05886 [Coniosporium apollinis CBS 100218]
MAAPSYLRSPFGALKRIKISPPTSTCQQRAGFNTVIEALKDQEHDIEKLQELAKERNIKIDTDAPPALDPETQAQVSSLRLPRSVQAVYLRPLRRAAQHGIPVCDLQLRTYSVRNMEFFADFALRAAYYLNLPAKGPIPLPRITERWTVPRSNFVHKKSQENFERITLRRLIQIQDGHPETVRVWLGYLQKHAYYGVGMKANVFEFEGLDVGKDMEAETERQREGLEEKLSLFGRRTDGMTGEKIREILSSETYQRTAHGDSPMMRK